MRNSILNICSYVIGIATCLALAVAMAADSLHAPQTIMDPFGQVIAFFEAVVLLALVVAVVSMSLIRRPAARRPCTHPNAIERRWIEDNTPMMVFSCPDCGYHDRGHVHGPVEGWVEGH